MSLHRGSFGCDTGLTERWRVLLSHSGARVAFPTHPTPFPLVPPPVPWAPLVIFGCIDSTITSNNGECDKNRPEIWGFSFAICINAVVALMPLIESTKIEEVDDLSKWTLRQTKFKVMKSISGGAAFMIGFLATQFKWFAPGPSGRWTCAGAIAEPQQADIRIAIYAGIMTGMVSMFLRYLWQPKPKPAPTAANAPRVCDVCSKQLQGVERAVENAARSL